MLTVLFSLRDCFRAHAVLQAEILALRHQLLVWQRSSRGRRLRLRWADRVLWVWLFAIVERHKSAACIIFTRAKLPDRQRLPSARVSMQRALRSFAMRSLVSCGRTPTARGLILGATDMEYRLLR